MVEPGIIPEDELVVAVCATGQPGPVYVGTAGDLIRHTLSHLCYGGHALTAVRSAENEGAPTAMRIFTVDEGDPLELFVSSDWRDLGLRRAGLEGRPVDDLSRTLHAVIEQHKAQIEKEYQTEKRKPPQLPPIETEWPQVARVLATLLREEEELDADGAVHRAGPLHNWIVHGGHP